MCGITGFWARSGGVPPAQTLARMTETLRHRGPDGEGSWSSNDVHFAHRRLAIVDLSQTGLQPMHSASGRFTVCFNGEVYNYRELRGELERAGQAPAWRGTSDTEVMLAAIEAWGLEAATARFVGMFAFALWDDMERRLHLVRDRLGVKPLYWTQTPAGLAFASELKALRCFPGFDASIDPTAVAGFVRFNCVPGNLCIHPGTKKLAPGTISSFSSTSSPPIERRYWDPVAVAAAGLANPFEGSEREALDTLDRLLREAVGLRMVADVPLGAFLSGGVDSSTVVALMQAQSSRRVHTFSIENESAAWDEGPAARAVACHLGTQHTAFRVTARDALDVIPLLPSMYDEPFADSSQIPTFLVSKLARGHVTVALSGDGGDELFGGYARHVWGPRVWRAEQVLPARVRRVIGRLLTSPAPARWDAFFAKAPAGLPPVRMAGIRMHKLGAALGAESAAALHSSLATHWRPEDKLLRQPVELPSRPQLLEDVGAEFMLADLMQYLPDDVLTKVDRASMAVSLEAREPLLDHRLVEFAWRLPQSMKVRGTTGKWALREVLGRYVPRDLISGPKMGFAVPLGEWLRGPLRDWAENLLGERRLRGAGWFDPGVVRQRWEAVLRGTNPYEYLIWDVLMFEAWRDAVQP